MRLKSLTALLVVVCCCVLLTGCFPTSAAPGGWSGPVVFNGSVYYGSMDRHLVKLDLTDQGTENEDGSYDGQYPPESEFTTYFYSSPVVTSDMVYIGGYSGKVYAITIDAEKKEWQFPQASDDFIGIIVGDSVVSEDVLYIGSSDKKLYALDISDNDELSDDERLLWSYQTGSKIWATPAVYNGTVYIGSFDHKMYALDAVDGGLKWAFKTGGAIVSTPIIYDDTIYFGSLDQKFYAVDIATGTLKEGFTPFKADNWFWGKAVAYNGNIIAASLDGKLYALDAESGNVAWEAEAGGSIRGNPALVDDRVIVGTDEGNSTGNVYCFDADTGEQVWASMPPEDGGPILGAIRASIGSSGNVVYVHANQKIYAFNASSSDKEPTYLWLYQSGDD